MSSLVVVLVFLSDPDPDFIAIFFVGYGTLYRPPSLMLPSPWLEKLSSSSPDPCYYGSESSSYGSSQILLNSFLIILFSDLSLF